MFRIKPKSRESGKNLNIQTLKCEYPDCDSIEVDSIKCNRCSKWLCEVSVKLYTFFAKAVIK